MDHQPKNLQLLACVAATSKKLNTKRKRKNQNTFEEASRKSIRKGRKTNPYADDTPPEMLTSGTSEEDRKTLVPLCLKKKKKKKAPIVLTIEESRVSVSEGTSETKVDQIHQLTKNPQSSRPRRTVPGHSTVQCHNVSSFEVANEAASIVIDSNEILEQDPNVINSCNSSIVRGIGKQIFFFPFADFVFF